MNGDLNVFARHSLRTSMFFPESRLLIAGNPKAAGTSLRWWLLPLHGVPVDKLTAHSLWGESAPFQAIWDANIDFTYTWHSLTAEQRNDATTSTDVMTVHPIRHPVTRAFSAWSGKFLNRESYYNDRLPSSFARLPDTIESPDELTAYFEDFMSSLAQLVQDKGWQAMDVHLWPQHRLLSWEPPGQLVVLRQESMDQGITEITEHLAAHGIVAGPVPRINETIVPYQKELVSGPALETMLTLYRGDFEAWGYEEDAPAAPARTIDFAWLNDVRGRNQRYQTLHEAVTSGRARERELEIQLAAAHTQEQELIESTSWRLTRPLRWMSRTAGQKLRRGS